MHIPDGFLDAKTLALTGALSAGGLAVAARQVNRTLPRNKIPLMGLGAAFVFAAQMLNFPVAGGTSGHLLGGVLAAVLLGPGAAAIVIACVLLVQALLFSDGGVLALGANIFNMAFIGAMVGYTIYRVVFRFLPGLRGRIAAAELHERYLPPALAGEQVPDDLIHARLLRRRDRRGLCNRHDVARELFVQVRNAREKTQRPFADP